MHRLWESMHCRIHRSKTTKKGGEKMINVVEQEKDQYIETLQIFEGIEIFAHENLIQITANNTKVTITKEDAVILAEKLFLELFQCTPDTCIIEKTEEKEWWT
jgi:hypothetical protein